MEAVEPRVAFMVMAHHEPAQFHRLVDRLTDEGAAVAAHIDAKADIRPFRRSDVAFAADRVRVNWGGYSLVVCMQRVLSAALAAFPDATHFQWLSGLDYPVRPLSQFSRHLADHSGVSFMAYEDMTAPGAQFPNIPREWFSHDLLAAPSRALARPPRTSGERAPAAVASADAPAGLYALPRLCLVVPHPGGRGVRPAGVGGRHPSTVVVLFPVHPHP